MSSYFQGPPIHTIIPKPTILGPYHRPYNFVDLVIIGFAMLCYGTAKLVGMIYGDGE